MKKAKVEMKTHILLISILMLAMAVAYPQPGSAVIGPLSINIDEEQELPELKIVDFCIEDENHRSVSEVFAKEKYCLKVSVKNEGDGAARNINAKVQMRGTPESQLSYDKNLMTGISINAGETRVVTIPITANDNLMTGTVGIQVVISEPKGTGCGSNHLQAQTFAYTPPSLKVDKLCLENKTVKKGTSQKLSFELTNEAYSKARDINVSVEYSEGINCSSSNGRSLSKSYPCLHGAGKERVEFTFFVPEDYNKDKVKVSVRVTCGGVTVAKESSWPVEKDDWDIDLENPDERIPVMPRRDNRLAIVIGNQAYDYSPVSYAIADASSFKRYCSSIFGIEPNNIKYHHDLSIMSMSAMIDEVCADFKRNMPDSSEIIFYYAGHAACGKDSDVYLLPVNVDPDEAQRGYRLRDLYSKLSETGASLVTVYLDACYTGTGRSEGLYAANGERGRWIFKSVEEELPANVVVFSASQKDEAAYACDKAGHGIFTYCLMLELKNHPFQNFGELSDQVQKKVEELSSKLKNCKRQSPTVKVSDNLKESWREIKIN